LRRPGNYRSHFKNWLREYDLEWKSKENKYTPDAVLEASELDISKYLAGYFDGDGRVNKYMINLSCAYKEGRERLSKLLDILKITHYIAGHLIIVRDLELFAEKIYPHLILKKNAEIRKNIFLGSFKIPSNVLKSIVDRKRKQTNIKKFLKSIGLSSGMYWKKDPTIKIESFLKILGPEASLFKENILRGPFSFQQVRDEKPDGINDVYDLEIDHEDHSFVASSYAIHNCFQEQFMQLAHELGGFSLEEANKLRKALVKPATSLSEELKKERIETGKKFVAGCIKSGLTKERAETLWNQEIMGFISYGFNKAHAVSYAYNSYQCGWLYTYYPKYWIKACLECDPKPEKAINVVRSLGYEVTSPDVNVSKARDWEVFDNGSCAPPLTSLKGIGLTAADELVRYRPSDGFKSLQDFFWDEEGDWRWTKLNKKTLQILMRAEALDSLGCVGEGKLFKNYAHMNAALFEVESIVNEKGKSVKVTFDKIKRQKLNLEDLAELAPTKDWSAAEKIVFQKEIFGFYDKSLILGGYRKVFDEFNIQSIDAAPDEQDKQKVWGLIEEVKEKTTRTKRPFLTVKVSGESDKPYYFKVWGTSLASTDLWIEGSIVVFSLDYDKRYGYSLSRDHKPMKVNK
jgi:hypothetical protein